mgnify:CR=1 FL=1
MSDIELMSGIISGLIASLIYAIITSAVSFNYKYKVVQLIYEMHGHLCLLENGIKYHNEIMIYASVDSIYRLSREILQLDTKIVIGCSRDIIKVINTFAAQCISIVILLGQEDRGYEDYENEARLNDIQRAFYFEQDNVMSDFAIELVFLLNKSKNNIQEYNNKNVHILDNVMHIQLWSTNNPNIKICKSNDEIISILNEYRIRCIHNGSKKDGISMSRQIPTPEEIFAKHELSIILQSDLKYRDKPDLEYIDNNGDRHGIEVVQACNADLREYENTRSEKAANNFNNSVLAKAYGMHIDTKCNMIMHNDKIGLRMINKAVTEKSKKLDKGNYDGYNSIWLAILCDIYAGFISSYIDTIVKKLNKSKFEKVFIISYNEHVVFEIHNGTVTKHEMNISNQNDELKILIIKEYLNMEHSKERDAALKRYLKHMLSCSDSNNYDIGNDISNTTLDKTGINTLIQKYTGRKNFIE